MNNSIVGSSRELRIKHVIQYRWTKTAFPNQQVSEPLKPRRAVFGYGQTANKYDTVIRFPPF